MWRRPAPEYVDRVKLVLGDLGHVCERCQLRLAGIKNPREHLAADTLSSRKDNIKNGTHDDEPLEKRQRLLAPPCRACLGVLQEDYMEEALEKLSSDVQAAGYDADHFTISLSLPISLALRGHSFNIYLKEKFDNFQCERVIPIKQIWKSLYPHRLEEKIGKKYVSGEYCEFYAELQFDFEDEEKELNAVQTMCSDEYAMRAKKSIKYHMGLVTRQGAEKSISQVSNEHFRSHYSVPPLSPVRGTEASVKMYHNSIFLGGRYNKYSRELSQTPWLVDGVRKMDTSLEELISDQIKTTFNYDLAKFCSSGREDVDVRMLGDGRPFMFEITNPRKTFFSPEELIAIEQSVNKSNDIVQIRDLAIISKDNVKLIKEGEDQKRKTYIALCIAPTPPHVSNEHLEQLSNIKDLKLMQKTPIRVLHRRPNAVRERTVFEMKAEKCSEENLKHFQSINKNISDETHLLFRISVTTQAGTYVKEFVHGDFGRTVPNLRMILNIPDLDIIALDVNSIDLEWPPK